MQGAGGMGADQKLAKHKLDQFGCIKSWSGLQNNDKCLGKIKNLA
jgi:hypothetical protein